MNIRKISNEDEVNSPTKDSLNIRSLVSPLKKLRSNMSNGIYKYSKNDLKEDTERQSEVISDKLSIF